MSKVLVSESNLTAIANAIRAKTGSSGSLTPAQMSTAIQSIEVGSSSGSGGTNSYKVTRPASIANQTLVITPKVSFKDTATWESVDGNLILEVKPSTLDIRLTPSSGYQVGTIFINGVDQGTDMLTGYSPSGDIVITCSEATVKQASDYLYEGEMTVGKAVNSNGGTYCYGVGVANNYDPNAIVEKEGSLYPTSFSLNSYGTEVVSYIKTLWIRGSLSDGELRSLDLQRDVKGVEGDSWVQSDNLIILVGDNQVAIPGDITRISGETKTLLFNYLKSCYESGAKVPVKVYEQT